MKSGLIAQTQQNSGLNSHSVRTEGLTKTLVLLGLFAEV
jgi:hypothetical protein